MDISSCYQLGYVIKTHGLKGELTIYLDVDYPEAYTNLESVLVEREDQLIPFFISSLRINGNKAVVALEGIEDIDEAEGFRSSKLYLPVTALPKLKDHQFYYHEIIGFKVEDKNLGALGEVKDVYDFPNQALVSMKYQGQEVLIPVRDEITTHVDRSKKVLFVDLPEGLLDIYLNPEE
jgi:16S rRNA processing protein RimM